MANIKTKIIHWLGGVTKKEHDEAIRNVKRDGAFDAFMETLKVMEDEYGNPKWGDVVYNYVVDAMQEIIDNQ